MAAITLVQLLDDIDGSEATHTVRFSVDGRDYEIDLNDKHEQQFRRSVDKWVKNARRPSRHQKRRPAGSDIEHRRAVREWAKASGLACPPRGRIPQAVVDAYDAAQ